MSISDTASPKASAGSSRERLVQSIGRALAAVPSLAPARLAWQRLGFTCGSDFVYQGCRAFDVELADGGMRIVRPDTTLPAAPLGVFAAELLAHGAGLIGWTWACRNPERTRGVVEDRTGTQFSRNPDGSTSFMVDPRLTDGALTILEELSRAAVPKQPNGADHIDHLVLMVGDADTVSQRIGNAFGFKPVSRNLKKSRYSFCKVGQTVLEIVGPPEPDKSNTHGRVWGITFGTPDIDHTVADIRSRGVEMPDPHDAIQGGRIVSVPTPVGGVQIAFMSE